MRLRGMLETVGAALAPPLCWSCRGPAPARSPLCPACEAQLPWLDPQAPLPDRSPLAAAWAPLSYEGVARDLVHALKFAGAAGVARGMARQACDALPPRAFPSSAALVPVPGDRARRRRRGFDHAEELAVALAGLTGLDVCRPLVRERARRARQRGLGRSARLAGAGVAVRARGPAPASCLLVDDVMTTGATARACAQALRDNGALSVFFLAYCRVL